MLFLSTGAWAWESVTPRDVTIDIVADGGGTFARYELPERSRPGLYRAYLEAEHGRNYGVRVSNNTGGRIGLVVAVDGRNIISGKKSHLRSNEPMYVLDPYQTNVYSGWRTSDQQVHRFYFTDVSDSYANAWGDRSAMGVITVAAFREVPPPTHKRAQPYEENAKSGRPSPSAPRAGESMDRAESAAPGTGFGDSQQSHVVRVHFRPQHQAFVKHFIKYEWRETLVRLGVIPTHTPPNRFWPEQVGQAQSPGYSSYPPGYWNRKP
jgi:hypothetical protein